MAVSESLPAGNRYRYGFRTSVYGIARKNLQLRYGCIPADDQGHQMAGVEYGKDKQQDIAMRVIADHIRTIAFSITDGQLPSNPKPDTLSAVSSAAPCRYGYTFLGRKQSFMYKLLLPVLIDNMGRRLSGTGSPRKDLIEKVIKEEEEAFLRTLETGIRLLDKTMDDTKAAGKTEISGKDAFHLI